MIIWKSKEELDLDATRPAQAYRKLIDLRWYGIEYCNQWLPKDSSEWRYSGWGYYNISITKHWKLGSSHMWYDGPHCSFSLGPIHFNWAGDRNGSCKKCYGEEHDT